MIAMSATDIDAAAARLKSVPCYSNGLIPKSPIVCKKYDGMTRSPAADTKATRSISVP